MTAIDSSTWRLRHGFTPPVAWDNQHLDKARVSGLPFIPRDPGLGLDLKTWHKPKLRLADYIDFSTAQVPAAVSRPHLGFQWPMFLNDKLGDCVIAMILHAIQDFHLDVATVLPTLVDADAESWYGIVGGYKPGDSSTDNGCDESVAMQQWEKGLTAADGTLHQIEYTVAVDPSNLLECRIAVYEFVNLLIGIALPQTAQGQTEWDLVGDPGRDPAAQPGSWGGHGIPYREYDADTFKCVTWGAELLLTTGFHNAYAQEAHVVLTKEQLNSRGVSTTGVQWADLASDLGKLTPAQVQKPQIKQPRPQGPAVKQGPSSPDSEEQ